MKYTANDFINELKSAGGAKMAKKQRQAQVLGLIEKAYKDFKEGDYSIGELLRMKMKLDVLLEMVDMEAKKLGGFRR